MRGDGSRSRDLVRRLLALPLLAIALALGGAAAGAAEAWALPVATPADPRLVEEILRESRVETTLRRASVSGYLAHLWRSFQEAVADFFAWASSFVGDWGSVLLWTGRILVFAALAALLLGLGVLLWRSRGRRGEAPAPAADLPSAAGPARTLMGAEEWRAEAEARLARGALEGALEAIWWWLARHLAGDLAEASWTSRELAQRSHRPELAPLLRRLDAMVYGTSFPSSPAVTSLIAEVEARL